MPDIWPRRKSKGYAVKNLTVYRYEHHAASGKELRPPRASLVAPAGMLDLDDVCAERAEDLGARRPGQRGREVDDPDARQRREGHASDPSGLR